VLEYVMGDNVLERLCRIRQALANVSEINAVTLGPKVVDASGIAVDGSGIGIDGEIKTIAAAEIQNLICLR